jgi:hypothetical protein
VVACGALDVEAVEISPLLGPLPQVAACKAAGAEAVGATLLVGDWPQVAACEATGAEAGETAATVGKAFKPREVEEATSWLAAGSTNRRKCLRKSTPIIRN